MTRSKVNAGQLDLLSNHFVAAGTNNRQLVLGDEAVTAEKLGFKMVKETIPASSFVYGTDSVYTLSNTALLDAHVDEHNALYLNGVSQKDLRVAVAPSATDEWQLTTTQLIIEGDITSSGDSYVIEYAVATVASQGAATSLDVGASIRKTSGVTLNSLLSFDTVVKDTDNMVNLGANSNIITVKKAGVYIVGVKGIYSDGGESYYIRMWMRKNGTDISQYRMTDAGAANLSVNAVAWSTVETLAVDDEISFYVNGCSIDAGGTDLPELYIQKIA